MNQWLNRSHPPMLFVAVFLCYFQAVSGILGLLGFSTGVLANSTGVYLFIVFGLGVGGVGIANDKKWGYWLAMAAAFVHLAMYFILTELEFLGTTLIVSFIFDLALVGLLTHRQIREYTRVWFR
jgi:uncharacterized membrane protein (DUF2068 family)